MKDLKIKSTEEGVQTEHYLWVSENFVYSEEGVSSK